MSARIRGIASQPEISRDIYVQVVQRPATVSPRYSPVISEFPLSEKHGKVEEGTGWNEGLERSIYATVAASPTYLSSSRSQLPALWSQPVWVSSLFKLANSRILHNVVVIANPLVIIKTAPNLTKPTLLPLLSPSTWFLSFHFSSLHLAWTVSVPSIFRHFFNTTK